MGFTSTIANSGGAGLSASPFVAPVSGFYYSSLTSTAAAKSRVYIRLNNDLYAHAWTDSLGVLAVQAGLHLNAGDKLCVDLQDGYLLNLGAHTAATFTIFLVRAD